MESVLSDDIVTHGRLRQKMNRFPVLAAFCEYSLCISRGLLFVLISLKKYNLSLFDRAKPWQDLTWLEVASVSVRAVIRVSQVKFIVRALSGC